jgi:BON domain
MCRSRGIWSYSATEWLAPASVALALVAFVTTTAAAADSRDVVHTLLARRALLQDARLAPYNLGVKLQNREVVIWGTVPSAELAKRAEDLVRGVPEFVHVRSEVRIDPNEGLPIPKAMPRYLPEPALREAQRPMHATPQAAQRPLEPASLSAPDPLPMIGAIVLPVAPVEAAAPVQVEAPRSGLAPAVLTVRAMFPRMTPMPRWQPRAAPPVQVPVEPIRPAAATLLAPDNGDSLEQRVNAVQRSQHRFRTVDAEVRDHVVTLRGPADQAATHELARLVARLPGVERVIVQER